MPQDRPTSIFGGFVAPLEAPWDDFGGTDLVPDQIKIPIQRQIQIQVQIQLQMLIQK